MCANHTHLQLLDILSKPLEYGAAIAWSDTGDAVAIWDKKKLEPVLDNFFRSTQWRSFRYCGFDGICLYSLGHQKNLSIL